MPRRWMTLSALTVCAFLLISACSGPDEKKQKFYVKGQTFFEQGDHVKARLELKNALQIDPEFGDAYFMLGQLELKEKNYRQAFGYFQKVVELDPQNDKAHLELGKLFLAARVLDRARQEADLLLEKDGANPDYRTLDAALLLAEEKPESARKALEALLADNVTNPDIYYMLASLHAKQGRSQEVEAILQKGLEANPDATALHLILARHYAGSEQPRKAIAQVEKLVALEPDNVSHKLTLAGLYHESGQSQAMEDTVDALIQANPQNEATRLQVAQFLFQAGLADKCEQILQEGLTLHPNSYDGHLLLAELYTNTNRINRAENLLQEALRIDRDPGNVDTLRVKNALARLHLRQQKPALAESLVDDVLAESPNNIDAQMIKGQLRLMAGDGPGAIAAFRTVTAEKPELIAAYLQLSQAHLANKEPSLALDTLRNGIDTHPNDKPLRMALARLLASRQAFDDAEAELNKILAIDPLDQRVRAALGDLLSAQGEMESAEQVYKTIRDQAPQMPVGYLKLSQFYWREGHEEEALAALQSGYQKNPVSVPLFTNLVRLHLAMNQIDKAVDLCREAIDRAPQSAFPYNALGSVLTVKEDYPNAIKAFNRAITIQPLWPPPHNGLARVYLLQGNTDEAIKKLEAAVRADQHNQAAFMTLANIYEQHEEQANAKIVYRRALAANPEMWPAANNLAFLIAESDPTEPELEEATLLAMKAFKMQPDNPLVLDTIGWIYYRRGNLPLALSYISKAIENDNDSPVLNYHLAVLLNESGRTVEALSALQKALSSENEFAGRVAAEKLMQKLDSES